MNGVVVFSLSWMSSAVPIMPSGPGDGDVGGARFRHEAQLGREIVGRPEHAIRTRDQRVVRLQRDEDDVLTTLGHQVQAVVEELTEEGEPGVERSRQARIRLHVGDEIDQPVVGGAELPVQTGAGH